MAQEWISQAFGSVLLDVGGSIASHTQLDRLAGNEVRLLCIANCCVTIGVSTSIGAW